MSDAVSRVKPNWCGRALNFVRSCVSSPLHTLLTAGVVALVLWALPGLLHWLFLDAVWTGASGRDCVGHDAACWIFLRVRTDQLLYGSYPLGERWRLGVAAIIGITTVIAVVRGSGHLRLITMGSLLIVASTAIAIMMVGGLPGLPYVPTRLWGGMLLTVVISAWTIVTALPLGLLLALARQSELPIISAVAVALIDLVRSLPLVGLLFLVIVMFPLFVPPGFETDKLMRALIAFTIFNAANFAEVFRGALQAIHRGQIEGGYSLGLPKWRVTALIVIPQVVQVSVPGVVNVCIAIIKETTIVLILGLFDFVGVLQAGISDPDWLMSESVRTTAYIFAGFVFWVICFSLSRYSLTIERRIPAAAAARGVGFVV